MTAQSGLGFSGIVAIQIPDDGATGEVLTKLTPDDYDYDWAAGGGGGAPDDAEYVVLSLNGTLTAERVLTPGTSMQLTDGGAGGLVTLDVEHLEFVAVAANPGGVPANTLYQDDGTNFNVNTVAMGDLTIPMMLTGDIGFGNPGTEQSGINVGGVTFSATAKVNDFGGSIDAMLVLHRHSTSFGSNLVMSRSNSDTSAHIALTPGQVISQIVNVGWSGTHYDIAGIMQVSVPAGSTVSPTSLAGQYDFFTTPDGSNTALLALQLGSDQSVQFSGAYRFPTVDGSANQILVTDGAGALAFDDQSTTAGLLSAEYRFSDSTVAADPGAGRYRFDTGAYSTVTEVFIDDFTNNNVDISNLLAQITKGDRLYFQNRTDSSKFVVFDVIVSAVDNTGWFTIGVEEVASGTFMGNNDKCIFIWSIDGATQPQQNWYEAMSTRSLVTSDFTIGSSIAEGVQAVSAGTGALVFTPLGISDDHPGVWGLRTGTTAAGRVFVIGRVGSYNIGVGGITRVGTWVRTPATLSDGVDEYVLRSGLFSMSLPNTIDFGVGFEYQFDQNGGRWQGITDATAESSLDTGETVVVDTWYYLEIEINADATSVEFFIDQVSVGTLAVAANIPQGTGFNNFYNTHIMKLAGTTSRDFFIDAYYAYQELSR